MSNPYPIFGSQDKNDDDGKVIDDFLIETDAPPPMDDALQPIPATTKENAKPFDRMLSGSISLTADVFTSPTQLLPADPKRKSLTINAYSTAVEPDVPTIYVQISDENGKVTGSSGFRVWHTTGVVTFNDYTGALWIQPSDGVVDAMYFTWSAVTS